ncbi:MAG TPA: alpha/beta fold hydrolase, partial [Chroococcales cyanobacterium]
MRSRSFLKNGDIAPAIVEGRVMLQSDDQLNSPALRLQPLNATAAMKKLKWRFIFKGLATVTLGAIVAVPIGLWLAFCPLFLQHYLLFYPLKYPVGQYDQLTVDSVKPTDVYFQSLNGSKLHGLLYQKKGAKNYCLFTHGNGGNVGLRQRSYQLLLREDCSVFVYDYQGYGKSEGSPDADKIIEDSNAAYEYATRTLGWDPAQMIIFGESLGTMLSTKLAAE